MQIVRATEMLGIKFCWASLSFRCTIQTSHFFYFFFVMFQSPSFFFSFHFFFPNCKLFLVQLFYSSNLKMRNISFHFQFIPLFFCTHWALHCIHIQFKCMNSTRNDVSTHATRTNNRDVHITRTQRHAEFETLLFSRIRQHTQSVNNSQTLRNCAMQMLELGSRLDASLFPFCIRNQ